MLQFRLVHAILITALSGIMLSHGLAIWDIDNRSMQFSRQSPSFSGLEIAPNGNYIATVVEKHELLVLDQNLIEVDRFGPLDMDFGGVDFEIEDFYFDENNKLVCNTKLELGFRVFEIDIETRTAKTLTEYGNYLYPDYFFRPGSLPAFSGNKWILFPDHFRDIVVFDVSTEKFVARISCEGASSTVRPVTIRNNNRVLVQLEAWSGREYLLFDLNSLETPVAAIQDYLGISQSGNLIYRKATARTAWDFLYAKDIEIQRVEDGTVLGNLNEVFDVLAFSNDDELIAVFKPRTRLGGKPTVEIMELESKKVVSSFSSTGDRRGARFDADGKYLFLNIYPLPLNNQGCTIEKWDVITGERIAQYRQRKQPLWPYQYAYVLLYAAWSFVWVHFLPIDLHHNVLKTNRRVQFIAAAAMLVHITYWTFPHISSVDLFDFVTHYLPHFSVAIATVLLVGRRASIKSNLLFSLLFLLPLYSIYQNIVSDYPWQYWEIWFLVELLLFASVAAEIVLIKKGNAKADETIEALASEKPTNLMSCSVSSEK